MTCERCDGSGVVSTFEGNDRNDPAAYSSENCPACRGTGEVDR